MDFLGTILLLFVYLLRPQEWLSIFETLRLAVTATLLGFAGLIFRKQGISIRDLFKVPMDWIIVGYFFYILYASPYWRDGFDFINNAILFYILTAQSLTNLKRIRFFLVFWAWSIFIIAFLAVASLYGFDPFDSLSRTEGMWKGRLVLHLSNYHNPNSLGHIVVPVISMVYLLYVWKRPIFIKEAMIPILALMLYCVYMTQSKGAFLAGFAAAVTGLAFGRPKIVQIIVVVFALTVGWAGLNMLPRMDTLSRNPSQEAGIKGRIQFFSWGLRKFEENRYGIGIGQFEILWLKEHPLPGGPHSSYVCIGTELGWGGLFFFTGAFYCGLRMLSTAKTRTVEEERVRRILMVLLISYIISCWLINWAYQLSFFMLCALCRSFHHHLLYNNPLEETVTEPEAVSEAVPLPALATALSAPAVPGTIPVASMGTITQVDEKTSVPADIAGGESKPTDIPAAIKWKRIGIIDLIAIWFLTNQVVGFWKYIIKHF